ncbi:TRAP transporter small permease [Martelella endophytica]|uniref:TRAP transporter small permease n=1 Tax=Martelella endophytica TaxID=1486262 RepID=UPI00069622A4|nr:TRAP transporter small permease [Martelella endophytica]
MNTLQQRLQEAERRAGKISAALCLAGGMIVIGMAFFTAFDIFWRSLTRHGVRGDFEIIELLSAWSVFLFFPYAQHVRQHIAVDFVTNRFPEAFGAVLQKLVDLLVAATAAFITWRICAGLVDAREHQEMTMMLRMPIWIMYVPAIFGWAGFAVIACLQVFVPGVKDVHHE